LDGVQERVATELWGVQPHRVLELVRVHVREPAHAVDELLVRLGEVRGPRAGGAPAAADARVLRAGEVELVVRTGRVSAAAGGVFVLRGALRLYRGPCRGTGRAFAVADDAFPAAGGRSLLRGAFPFGGVPPLRARWFNLEPFAREGMRPRNVPRARRAVAAGAADQDRAGLDRIRPEPRVDPTLAPTHAHALAPQPERGRSRGKADQREARDSRRGRPHPELPCNTRRARHGAARDDEVRTTVPTSEGKVGILG